MAVFRFRNANVPDTVVLLNIHRRDCMSRSLTEQTDILADETVLYGSWTPEVLPEHEMELDDNDLHDAPAPVARSASPHNAFIYEKTGQRKTVGVTHKLDDLRVFAGNNDTDVCIVRYSSTKDNLGYQIIANLVAELSGEKPRGYDKKTVFDFLYENPQALGGIVIIVRAYRLHP